MDEVLHFVHRLLWGPDIPMLLADPATTALLINFAIQTAIAVAASAIINAIFPTRIEGPRLSELHVQSSTYGNAIPLLLGQAVRVAGNVIWSSGLQETKNTESAKGGPQVTSYTYKVDCAIALGERPNGIAGILKIWGFGKLIYDAALNPPGADPQGDIPEWSGNVFELPFLAVTLGMPFVQQALGTQAVFESITVYPGNFTQMPDPTMEAALGVGNVPAYRGTSYVVIKGLQLADFGNVLPNLEFLVIPNPDETVGSAVQTIVERSGITPDQYQICDADPQKGYVVGRVMTASAAIAPLAFAHQFDMVDDAGLLRLIKRDEDIVAIISTDDLAGHAFGEDRPDPIQWERAAVTQLPKEASVVFSDPARDFQENSMTARRSEGTADSNISIELAMTLEADDARALADRALWEAWLASQMAKTQSTDRLIDMRVGRVYLFETPAGLEALRVFSKTRGRNGVIEFELRRERGELYTSTSPGTSGSIPPQEIAIPGPTELVLLDMPMLRDADDDSGFYFGVVGSETGWRGSAVMRALSISEDFITFQSAGVQSVVGDVVGTLADGPTELDGTGTFDEVNTLTVELRHAGMTLESVSDDAIEAGANAAYVCNPDDTTEGEVIQFGVATLTSGGPNRYELSHLRRGKRGTEFATSLHASGEIFVLLQQNGATMRRDFGVSDLNLERLYKAVSLLLNADDVDYIPFTNTGVGLRPYSPINLDILGNSVGELVLVWDRRSRLDSGVLGEATELYTVRIMNALGTVIIREEQVTEESFTYTEAMQIADFGDIVTSLRWRVAQVSAVYGNGIFSEFNDVVVISSGLLSSAAESDALESAMLSSAAESDALESDSEAEDDVLLKEVVTTGSATEVIFSSSDIPTSGFRDLEIRIRGRGDNSSVEVEIGLQFNADTGSNYNWARNYAGAGPFNEQDPGSSSSTHIWAGSLPGATAVANSRGYQAITIANFLDTAGYKATRTSGAYLGSSGDILNFNSAGQWLNANAITQARVYCVTGGAFVDGTVVSLYGRQ